MQQPTGISVLVLTYKHSAYIEACLQGIINQDYKGPLQVVVADDASPDDTASRITAFAERGHNIELLINPVNLGAARNFEAAVRNCKYPYLAFCEGDDQWIDPRKLSVQAALLDTRPEVALVYNDYQKIDTAGKVVLPRSLEPQPHRFGIEHLLLSHGPSTNAVMMRRSAIPGEFPKAFFEVPNPDVFIFAWALMQGHGHYIDAVYSAYRLHEGGVWSSLHTLEQQLIRLQTRLDVLDSLKDSSLNEYALGLRRERFALMQRLALQGHGLYGKYAPQLSRSERTRLAVLLKWHQWRSKG